MFMLAIVSIFAPSGLCEELANFSRLFLWSFSTLKDVLISAKITKFTPSGLAKELTHFIRLAQTIGFCDDGCVMAVDVLILAAITILTPARFGKKIARLTLNGYFISINVLMFAFIGIFAPTWFCKELAHLTRFLNCWAHPNGSFWSMNVLISAFISPFAPAWFLKKLTNLSSSRRDRVGFWSQTSEFAWDWSKMSKYHLGWATAKQACLCLLSTWLEPFCVAHNMSMNLLLENRCWQSQAVPLFHLGPSWSVLVHFLAIARNCPKLLCGSFRLSASFTDPAWFARRSHIHQLVTTLHDHPVPRCVCMRCNTQKCAGSLPFDRARTSTATLQSRHI